MLRYWLYKDTDHDNRTGSHNTEAAALPPRKLLEKCFVFVFVFSVGQMGPLSECGRCEEREEDKNSTRPGLTPEFWAEPARSVIP